MIPNNIGNNKLCFLLIYEERDILFSEDYRKEKDTLGEVQVPSDAHYGSQTQRAIDNFPISGVRLPRSFIRAQGIIKAAAAKANMDTGSLDKKIGEAIIQASEEVIDGKWDHQFLVDIYQAGAGTSQNMNANEIIGNRASILLDIPFDEKKKRVHPHDHVNMSQSTNDTFPSALNIAAVEYLVHHLLPSLKDLQTAMENKSEEFKDVLKTGRTHLHDAVPMRLGQEFSGFAATIKESYESIHHTTDALYELGLGGNAIGTSVNLNPDYIPNVISDIKRRTSLPFREPENLFSFMQNRNAPIRTMMALKELAIHLIKITSDLRLLSSGPRTGLYEITLPGVQPGSTIMPGKVNPAILEMTHMVCCQIIGYETAITTAGIAGQLEINVMMPLIAYTLLQSIEIMTNAITTLEKKCINGIKANKENCQIWMNASLSVVTGVSPIFGYDLASQIGKQADEENKTIRTVLEERGLLTEETKKAIDPRGMV
ncbi:class II fumarate hydratase [Evansella tamaricis]|uniref:Aspartate ammonia-lyase n=1 Tax=Evansella tamaricis TaxID=2069301 RepID=A0ABS6JEQ4_9BACI|nr:aspartate ammonia-lyase [Evansella tamaricis]MBU9712139.1 aspartate ammonia-lyase [Evansella tamaricis]